MSKQFTPNGSRAFGNGPSGGEIPVQRFIEVRSATAPVYSLDGSGVFFLSNTTGVPQVWFQSDATPWPRQITFFPDRVMSLHVAPRGQVLCINADMSGTENAQLFLTDYEGVNVLDLSQDSNHIYQFGGWSSDGRQFSYSSNRRNGRDFDIYLYNLDTNTHSLVHQSDYTNHAHALTSDGRFVLMSRLHTNLDNDLYLVDIATGELRLLTSHEGEAHYGEMTFSPDGRRLFLATNQDSEFTRLAMLELENCALTFLTADNWDTETVALSPDGEHLAFSKNEAGTSQLYLARIPSGDNDSDGFPPSHSVPGLPPGVIEGIAWKPASHTLAVAVNSPRTGSDIWTIETHTDATSRITFSAMSGIPEDAFHEPVLIHYATFDDCSIPAYYYVPKHAEGPYSVVVYVHGGPESQSRNDFNPILQYFVRQGYAVLVPNVRGSSGYGRRYIHLDDVRKRMDSVADLAKAVDWLTTHGNADPKKIAVMGRSYGGFMVLAAVTHYPELWAAGIDIVGIANFRTFMENTSPYRRHLREPEYGTIEADGDYFDEIAPSHRVHDIVCPMFVTHGANDPRVPIGEAEGMVTALRDKNHPVQYIRLEDEGHGLVKLKNRILVFGQIAEFLDQYVGVPSLSDSQDSDISLPYRISSKVDQTFAELIASPQVQAALEFAESDHGNTLADQISITEIPAPSFEEATRKAYYQSRLEALGLQDVQTDSEGNVFGIRPGSGHGPKIFISAHLDTVFPEGTDTQVKIRDGILYAPGISDDGRGLTVTLAVLRALNEAKIQTQGDLIFGATVGEEGLGDLRGVKAFFRDNQVDGFISIEPDSLARVTYLATGSHRYKVTYRGTGGHSFGAFGTPSAIHALGRAIGMISNLTVPTDPKTTYTVGTVRGGTSVNTIAALAEMMIDIRSNSEQELLKVEQQILDMVYAAAEEENNKWGQQAITVDVELVGNRPAGSQSPESMIVQAALASSKYLGLDPQLDSPSSTDSNVPISLGIPAVTLGGGGTCGGVHTIEEFFDPTDAFYGVQSVLLTVLGLVGVEGIQSPLLPQR